jgi:4-amino-4-deoxy-L-arabinose transferase-like glycosyltransferase
MRQAHLQSDRRARGAKARQEPVGFPGRFYQPWFIGLFALAALLRVLLCWANPPENSFDDHYTPILMAIKNGVIPAKDACFQCYHPPVFYWISAKIGQLAIHAGMDLPAVVKLLQFVCCFYGILTVGVCGLILGKFKLSNFSRLLAFGIVCFLPRHIYMSAMNSNDTISYLFVAVSIYLVIIAWERGLPLWSVAAASVVLSLTIFTKYTAFAVLPAVLTPFILALLKQPAMPRKKLLLSAIGVFLLPLAILASYLLSNQRQYHSPLPWNVTMYDPSAHRPRDPGGISFFTFKPWQDMATPMLAPGKLHSFWTLMSSGMWWDTEPYFQDHLDSNIIWWNHYSGWYQGQGSYPGRNPSMSGLTILQSCGLIGLGLCPLALMLAGFYKCVRFSLPGGEFARANPTAGITLGMFPVLALFNAAGIIALTVRLPVYNTMKPSYLLDSMPAFAIFLGLGLMLCEKNTALRRTVLTVFFVLFGLSTLHILNLFYAFRSTPL